MVITGRGRITERIRRCASSNGIGEEFGIYNMQSPPVYFEMILRLSLVEKYVLLSLQSTDNFVVIIAIS
jgi:CRISPR/Cas system-associated exonuclease Cas4 (RecB family)